MERKHRLVTVLNYNTEKCTKHITPKMSASEVAEFLSSGKFIHIDGQFIPTRYIDGIKALNECSKNDIKGIGRQEEVRKSYYLSAKRLFLSGKMSQEDAKRVPYGHVILDSERMKSLSIDKSDNNLSDFNSESPEAKEARRKKNEMYRQSLFLKNSTKKP